MKKYFLSRIAGSPSHGASMANVACATGLMLALFSSPVQAQHAYPSAEAAADAFVDAVASNDTDELNTILGANWRRFVPTQEIDRDDINDFLGAWARSHRIVEEAPDRAALEIGGQGWTLPIPIVKHSAGWQFDTRGGADEMRTRRIGRNELSAMQATLAYFDAQKEYAGIDRDNDGVLQYAQKFMSTKGRHDGLYWPEGDNEPESPIGPLFADLKPGEGYHGYHYRILHAQGKDAPGGAYNYVIGGRMTSGFALVAWPIRYGETGVKSFLISHDGQLYEKDLGPKSAAIARQMGSFNPDASWSKVPLDVTTAGSAGDAAPPAN